MPVKVKNFLKKPTETKSKALRAASVKGLKIQLVLMAVRGELKIPVSAVRFCSWAPDNSRVQPFGLSPFFVTT
ncbi:hypothetical protein HRM2_20580 [Desulforapulum autotrophicum HRM2]|uniref:Uncharacterized protein n=1 Tax=Desulforapulum autotrophicum (strain ATCC 43914 / DSM 3382 / VKM B-1955 / HRM2) TaxID=177437 RepID=C0QCT0_DESAH|nr:hypothetical protein HRM2_20580 [Desulforapulum autotrophicum HRM2]